jgi:glycosyltransferase involved in cell wall biosynthesis
MTKNIRTKITHLTSVHARYDTRIFVKECSSLAKNSHYEVNLIVADGFGNETKNSVNIIDIGAKLGGRISRATKTTNDIYEKAVELNSDIYHLHDPELIRVGLKLKSLGKKVIFDAHEDTPKQLLNHPKFNIFMRIALSKAFGLYEKFALKKFDYIITATPYIRDKFFKINKHSMDINNFPILAELSNDTLWRERRDEVCYIGGIARIRGIVELTKAMEHTKGVKLNLAGKFVEAHIENEVKSYYGWSNVKEYGFVGRNEISDILKRSKAGIVTLHKIPNYTEALPVKMFEYMAAGIPVIASDIPLWQSIIDDAKCGICVDPYNPQKIAEAIRYIIANPKEAERMGQNGKKAVIEKYNWATQEQKLFKVYEELYG